MEYSLQTPRSHNAQAAYPLRLVLHGAYANVEKVLGMGSAFEPWEFDDGGVDQKGLSVSANFTPILLAVDQSDPARAGVYFEDNLLWLRRLGFKVETFRPNAGTHEVTEEMKTAVLQAMP